MVLCAHSGWEGERSRGSTALEDWPDSILYMTKNAAKERHLTADGRDVDLSKTRLDYDPESRRYTLRDDTVFTIDHLENDVATIEAMPQPPRSANAAWEAWPRKADGKRGVGQERVRKASDEWSARQPTGPHGGVTSG